MPLPPEIEKSALRLRLRKLLFGGFCEGGLVLVNMTEDTLHNVTVRYRTDTGGTYFGGLSYTATVEELAPGASQTVLAAECYMGLPSVIAVSADES